MKRVIIDLQDDYADCLSATAIGMINNAYGGTQLNVHGGIAFDLHKKDSAHYEQFIDADGKINFREVK